MCISDLRDQTVLIVCEFSERIADRESDGTTTATRKERMKEERERGSAQLSSHWDFHSESDSVFW